MTTAPEDKPIVGIPVPDPSARTLEQSAKEVACLREILEARLNAMDKAIALMQSAVDRSPSIAELNAFTTEKFEGIEKQFIERDKRTEQLSVADKTAIAAALQAQKEAAGAQTLSLTASIAKTETGFTKEIDGIKTLIANGNLTLDNRIKELTGRMDRGEGKEVGIQHVTDNSHANAAIIISVIVALISIASLILVIARLK